MNLPDSGTVLLSSDVAHNRRNFLCRCVPSVIADPVQSVASKDQVDKLLNSECATPWFNHDIARSGTLPRRSDLISFMPSLTFVHEAVPGWLRANPLVDCDSKRATIDVIAARNRKLSAVAAAFLAHVIRHLRVRGSSTARASVGVLF